MLNIKLKRYYLCIKYICIERQAWENSLKFHNFQKLILRFPGYLPYERISQYKMYCKYTVGGNLCFAVPNNIKFIKLGGYNKFTLRRKKKKISLTYLTKCWNVLMVKATLFQLTIYFTKCAKELKNINLIVSKKIHHLVYSILFSTSWSTRHCSRFLKVTPAK